jgi:hypothetical protein
MRCDELATAPTMKTVALPFLSFVVAVLLTSAGSAEAQSGSVRGTVIDRETGAPIKHAIVSAEPQRSRATDEEGRYELCRIEMGETRLTVAAPGFERLDTLVHVRPGMLDTVDVSLHRRPREYPPRIIIREDFGASLRDPLIFVDGVEHFHSVSGCEDPPPGMPLLSSIAPGDIDIVEVVQGPRAAAEFGPEAAARGVVLITTHQHRRPLP